MGIPLYLYTYLYAYGDEVDGRERGHTSMSHTAVRRKVVVKVKLELVE
jgi:hypothetical protein